MTTDSQGHKVLVCDNGTGVSCKNEFRPHFVEFSSFSAMFSLMLA